MNYAFAFKLVEHESGTKLRLHHGRAVENMTTEEIVLNKEETSRMLGALHDVRMSVEGKGEFGFGTLVCPRECSNGANQYTLLHQAEETFALLQTPNGAQLPLELRAIRDMESAFERADADLNGTEMR